MSQTETNPLARDFGTLSLIRFALPGMVMMLFMGLYTVVDTLFVARFVNTDALSAINIVCPVINLIVGLGTMLAAGGSAVIAADMGGGKNDEARRNFTLLIAAGALLGLTVTAVGLLFTDEIILGLGASRLLLPYCRDYLRIQLLFAVCNMMQVLYQNLFVTAGTPPLGLVLSVLAGTANLVLDYLFIVRLQMGIAGAALGTGIGYLIPTLAGTAYFSLGHGELRFCRPGLNLSFLLKSSSNGASELVSQLATAVTTFLYNAVMMKLAGEDGVAAVTVIIYSQFLLTSVIIGFSMGAAPAISYNCGSGNKKRRNKIIRASLRFVTAVSLFLFLFSLLAGGSVAGIFAGGNQTVRTLARTGFFLFSFSFLFSGCNIFASACFTALSDGKSSALISFLRTFGFPIIGLFILPPFLQTDGVWLVIPASELSTFLLTLRLLAGRRTSKT